MSTAVISRAIFTCPGRAGPVFRLDLPIFIHPCFANRIVNIWNSLPSYVVSAETVNCFKTRLDRFWLNQDIIYNFHSEIHGTGSRSEITVKSSLE